MLKIIYLLSVQLHTFLEAWKSRWKPHLLESGTGASAPLPIPVSGFATDVARCVLCNHGLILSLPYQLVSSLQHIVPKILLSAAVSAVAASWHCSCQISMRRDIASKLLKCDINGDTQVCWCSLHRIHSTI
jgi:hypothetical protein